MASSPEIPEKNARKRKRLLLVDDQEVFLGVLRDTLERLDFDVVAASNGATAIQLFSMGVFDVVLSDVNMLPGTGFELFEHVRNSSKTPVILMTGFPELLSAEKAEKSGVHGFLPKPFSRDQLIEVLNRVLNATKPGEIQGQLGDSKAAGPSSKSVDQEFARIEIDEFISGLKMQFDVFIRIGESKYVKITNAGDEFDLDRLRMYKERGLHFLYLRREDFKRYVDFSLFVTERVLSSPDIERSRKLGFLKYSNHLLLEYVYTHALEPEAYEGALTVVETTLSTLIDNHDYWELLNSLNSIHDSIYAHSLGVALYGVMIARQTKWHAANIHIKIATGGLLHDIGKKSIDPAIVAKPRFDLTPEERTIFESHPQRGFEMLSKSKKISNDVLQIILQHHENFAGDGYPKKLKKIYIHPFAKLISVANEFCMLSLKPPAGQGMTPTEAITRMYERMSHKLDMELVAALANIFKFTPTN